MAKCAVFDVRHLGALVRSWDSADRQLSDRRYDPLIEPLVSTLMRHVADKALGHPRRQPG